MSSVLMLACYCIHERHVGRQPLRHKTTLSSPCVEMMQVKISLVLQSLLGLSSTKSGITGDWLTNVSIISAQEVDCVVTRSRFIR